MHHTGRFHPNWCDRWFPVRDAFTAREREIYKKRGFRIYARHAAEELHTPPKVWSDELCRFLEASIPRRPLFSWLHDIHGDKEEEAQLLQDEVVSAMAHRFVTPHDQVYVKRGASFIIHPPPPGSTKVNSKVQLGADVTFLGRLIYTTEALEVCAPFLLDHGSLLSLAQNQPPQWFSPESAQYLQCGGYYSPLLPYAPNQGRSGAANKQGFNQLQLQGMHLLFAGSLKVWLSMEGQLDYNWKQGGYFLQPQWWASRLKHVVADMDNCSRALGEYLTQPPKKLHDSHSCLRILSSQVHGAFKDNIYGVYALLGHIADVISRAHDIFKEQESSHPRQQHPTCEDLYNVITAGGTYCSNREPAHQPFFAKSVDDVYETWNPLAIHAVVSFVWQHFAEFLQVPPTYGGELISEMLTGDDTP